jgi:hypothetical protein
MQSITSVQNVTQFGDRSSPDGVIMTYMSRSLVKRHKLDAALGR